MTEYKVCGLETLSTTRAEEVDYEKDYILMKEIIAKIKKTMRKNNLTSLSAPAIGYNKRIFCVDFSDKEIKTFINPMVLLTQGMELTREVCSSIPNKEFIRPRHTSIDIIYQRPDGTIKQNQFKGMASTVIQHELDHLDAITLNDIGLEIDSDFDDATDEERFEITDMYLKYLNEKHNNLVKEIEQDDVAKVMYEAETMSELLAQGKIKIEPLNDEDKKE